MTRDILIKKTMDHLTKLSDQKLKEVSDFTEFLINKIEDQELIEGIRILANNSKVFKYLEEEEDLYSVENLKERYN